MYFGTTVVPSGAVPPNTYVTTAAGVNRQPGGRGPVSDSSAVSSEANVASAWSRSSWSVMRSPQWRGGGRGRGGGGLSGGGGGRRPAGGGRAPAGSAPGWEGGRAGP